MDKKLDRVLLELEYEILEERKNNRNISTKIKYETQMEIIDSIRKRMQEKDG